MAELDQCPKKTEVVEGILHKNEMLWMRAIWMSAQVTEGCTIAEFGVRSTYFDTMLRKL